MDDSYFLYVVIPWFIFSIIVGVYANRKGRSAFLGFLLSVLLSPIIGFLIMAALGPDQEYLDAEKILSGEYKRCTYCAGIMRKKATVCQNCGKDVSIPPFEEKNPILNCYLFDKGEQKGRFSTAQVKAMYDSGAVNSDTLYWTEGMREWESIDSLFTAKQPIKAETRKSVESSSRQVTAAKQRSIYSDLIALVAVLGSILILVLLHAIYN